MPERPCHRHGDLAGGLLIVLALLNGCSPQVRQREYPLTLQAVDVCGRPVPGVRVSVRSYGVDGLGERPPQVRSSTVTDADGVAALRIVDRWPETWFLGLPVASPELDRVVLHLDDTGNTLTTQRLKARFTPSQVTDLGGVLLVNLMYEPSDATRAIWLPPPPRNQPQPRFACHDPHVNARSLYEGETLTYWWRITNAGDAPLFVTDDIFAPGDITVGTARTISPGDTQRVEFTLRWADWREKSGRHTLRACVLTNDRHNRRVELTTNLLVYDERRRQRQSWVRLGGLFGGH